MRNLRVAVEGCGHGTLDAIYASVTESCKVKGWPAVDLLIIGGDFQAVRNSADLNCMAVPVKYRELGDFHQYYSGKRKAPYLTLFVGGNHEASNHLRELYYGGWVAPNIYYLGAANVLRMGPFRIAGLSGIWKGYDFKKPHFERLPLTQDEIRSIFHVREIDTRKLLQLRSQVDIGLSHDWPRGIEWKGNWKALFQQKPFFETDAKKGQLGSVAAQIALDHLRPPFWFSAHLHVKYAAILDHTASKTDHSLQPLPVATTTNGASDAATSDQVHNNEEIDLDMDDEPPPRRNSDEIDLDDNDDAAPQQDQMAADEQPTTSTTADETISDDLRAQLPASFAAPQPAPKLPDPPTTITNTTTKFLALDKCLPRRNFLQLLEIPLHNPSSHDQSHDAEPFTFQYDPEWLAITRAFALAEPLQLNSSSDQNPRDKGRAHYAPLIDEAATWVHQNITQKNKLQVPDNFEITAPTYDPEGSVTQRQQPREYNNPQTQALCELLDIPNQFWADELEIQERMATPAGDEEHHGHSGFHQRGRGRGRGGWRGSGGRGRGRGRGSPHRGGPRARH